MIKSTTKHLPSFSLPNLFYTFFTDSIWLYFYILVKMLSLFGIKGLYSGNKIKLNMHRIIFIILTVNPAFVKIQIFPSINLKMSLLP